MSITKYKKADANKKIKMIEETYNKRDGKSIYATSRDINLRELEIDFIINAIKSYKNNNNLKVLDIGCGNGYTDICIGKLLNIEILGVDISPEMIEGANYLKSISRDEIKGQINFKLANILDTTFENNYFDIVISERCLLNLPSKESQFQMIKRIWEILKPDGIYVMVEGSYDGLIRLNEIRKLFGLKEIPDKDENNFSSLKFVEKELENYVINYFDISKKHFFGMYYFISRVIHPLLVYPEEPKFESRINEIARLISSKIPNYEDIGHIVGYVLSARKNIK